MNKIFDFDINYKSVGNHLDSISKIFTEKSFEQVANSVPFHLIALILSV